MEVNINFFIFGALIIDTLASSIPQNDDIQNQLKKEITRIDLVKSEIASMSLATVNKLY